MVRRTRVRNRDQFNPAHRARLEAEDARAALQTCAMPLCDKPVIRLDGRGLGICLPCSLDVMLYVEHIEDLPALSEKRAQYLLRVHHEGVRAAAAKASAVQQPGWIYYILIGDRIKIGYSVDVKRRLRAYPPDSPLLALHPGTKQLEHEMHVQFAGSRAAGREHRGQHKHKLHRAS